ncbi:MAG: aa3-type cytochrome c oxidase subunit IV [Rhodospirillales bacterium]|nr:aa3-type cytochrome c oxidase subunit IV [Rhodospirillales bacterium]
MATPASNSPAPVTEDAFLAERQRAWAGFCNATFIGATAVAVLLVLMTIFLV